MGTPARPRTAPLLLLVLALLLGSLASLAGPSAAAAPSAARSATKGTVTGQIKVNGKVPIRMRWFTSEWQFINERSVKGDIYSLPLAPGTYYVQFVDQRPAYDLDKFAPTDIKVTIRAGKTIQKDVRMQRGAGITGTVKAGGKAAGGAQVVAANSNQQSFPVKANDKGQFALGGLPDGSYSVFVYDRTKTWVGKSTFVRGLRSGGVKNIAPNLTTKAGSLRVELEAGGRKMGQKTFVTAVSKATGQFWTTKASRGVAIFKGLYPGGYTMVAPGVGDYLPEEGPIRNARVRSGGADLVSTFEWTHLGASVVGTVYDEVYPDFALAQVVVLLFNEDGAKIGQATTASDGSFRISGPIPTQKNVTLQIQPGGGNPPYLSTFKNYYCKFTTSQQSGIGLVEGEELAVGDLQLPQLPQEEQDDPNGCGL